MLTTSPPIAMVYHMSTTQAAAGRPSDIFQIYGSVDQHGYESVALFYGATVNPPRLARWVGRCKACGVGRKLDGVVCTATRRDSQGRAYVDHVVVAPSGAVHRCGGLGTDQSIAHVRCGDHWVAVRRVYDGHRAGRPRHECSAKCRSATGPSCECKCKGANHGGGL